MTVTINHPQVFRSQHLDSTFCINPSDLQLESSNSDIRNIQPQLSPPQPSSPPQDHLVNDSYLPTSFDSFAPLEASENVFHDFQDFSAYSARKNTSTLNFQARNFSAHKLDSYDDPFAVSMPPSPFPSTSANSINQPFTQSPLFSSHEPHKPLNEYPLDLFGISKASGDIYGDEDGCESFFLSSTHHQSHANPDPVQYEEPEAFDLDDDDDDDNSYMFPSDDDDDLYMPASALSDDEEEYSGCTSNAHQAIGDTDIEIDTSPPSSPPSTPPPGPVNAAQFALDEDFDAMPCLLSPPSSSIPSRSGSKEFGSKRFNDSKEFGSKRFNDAKEFGSKRFNDSREFGSKRFNDSREFGSKRFNDSRESGLKRSHHRSISQPINNFLGATTKSAATRLERVIGQQLTNPFAFTNPPPKSDESASDSESSPSPASEKAFDKSFEKTFDKPAKPFTARASKRRGTGLHAGPHRCDLPTPGSGKPCGKMFSRPYDLIRHQDTIHAPVRKTYTCPVCGPDSKTFSRMDALSRHIRVKHSVSSAQATAAAHKTVNGAN